MLPPMLYFAYASNMNPAQMKSRAPTAGVVGVATLADRRLHFPIESAGWNGGTASVQLAHGSTVYGVLYEVDDAAIEALDRYEGYFAPHDPRNRYERETVNVDLVRPDDGSFPRRVRALIYLAGTGTPAPPSRRYLDTILEGARHHRLPEEYVAALAAIPAASEAGQAPPTT